MKNNIKNTSANSTAVKGEALKTVTFTLLADFHYKENMYMSSIADLKSILKRAEDSSSAFVLSAGDLCNDFTGSPELTNTYLNYHFSDGSLLPAYNIYGNHELEARGNSMEKVTPLLTNDKNVVWGTADGSFDCNISYYYFESNGFRIVCTDTNYSYNSAKSVWEHNETASYGPPKDNTKCNSLGPAQLLWLENVLTDAANSSIPCIVIGHDSFSGVFAVNSSPDAEAVRKIYSKVNSIREGTVVMSINGHYHTNHRGYLDGVFYLDMNSVRNCYWCPSDTYHYSSDTTFRYEKYDDDGNLIEVTDKSINALSQSRHTWFSTEPLSAVVTVNELGEVSIDGIESSWLCGLAPDTTLSGCEPIVTSGTFSKTDI